MSLLQSALSKLRGEGSPVPDKNPAPAAPPSSPDQAEMTQRFAQFIMMQAQQVMMMLGLTPSPYGQMPPALQEAKLFIDQLEMVSQKTKGNLSKQEAALLEKIIDQCNMAFTKVSGGTPPSLMPSRSTPEISLDELVGPADIEEPTPPPAPTAPQRPEPATQLESHKNATPSASEDRKKFVKSYGSF